MWCRGRRRPRVVLLIVVCGLLHHHWRGAAAAPPPAASNATAIAADPAGLSFTPLASPTSVPAAAPAAPPAAAAAAAGAGAAPPPTALEEVTDEGLSGVQKSASTSQPALSKEETLGCPQLQFWYLGSELGGEIQHEALGPEKFIDKPSSRNTQTLPVEMVMEETLLRGVRLDIFELRMPRDLQRSELKSTATLDDTAVLRRVGFEALFPNKGRIESVVELPSSVILSPDGAGGDSNSSVADGDVSLLYFNVWDITQMPLTSYFKVSCPGGGDGSYQIVEQLLQAGGFGGELLRHGSSSWVVSVRGMLYFQELPADRGTIQFSDFAAEPGELTIENMPPSAVVETNSTKFRSPQYSFVANVTELPEGGLKPVKLEHEAARAPVGPPGPGGEPDSELNDLESLKKGLAEAPGYRAIGALPPGASSSSQELGNSGSGGDGSGGDGSNGSGGGKDETPDSPAAAMAVGFSLAGAAVVVMVAIVLYWQFGGRRVRVKDENEDATYKSVSGGKSLP